MPLVAPKIQTAIGKVFDVMQDLFFEPGTVVKFVKASETTDDFDDVITLDGKWWLKCSDFRQSYLLQVAYSEDTFNADIITATHIQIDDDFYVIETGDTVKPKGTDLTWKFFCRKFTQRKQFNSLY